MANTRLGSQFGIDDLLARDVERAVGVQNVDIQGLQRLPDTLEQRKRKLGVGASLIRSNTSVRRDAGQDGDRGGNDW